MINGIILILILLIYHFLIAMPLGVPLVVYTMYISQLIRSVRASSHSNDFNNRNKFLTAKLLSKAIGIINIAKHFPNFIVGTLN